MKEESRTLTPKLRFPEFKIGPEWDAVNGDELFDLIDRRPAPPGLPILAITQEQGAVPRDQIDYHVSVTEASIASYKEVQPADFIISLRSFQGGIEYSRFHGICSPAYLILKRKGIGSDDFFRHLFKSERFIQQLTRNIEGLRDGKMISYKQLSEQLLPAPDPAEQQKIAACLTSVDEQVAAEGRKLEALGAHKKGLMQQLFPREGETRPRLRLPEFRGAPAWRTLSIQELIDRQFIVGHQDGNHGELYPRAEEFSPTGIPYITANDFKSGHVEFENCKSLPAERALKFTKGVAKDGDILFAHNATVGPVAKLNTSYELVILSTTATYFRCNQSQLSNDFLRCALEAPEFVEQYTRVMSQSTRDQVPIGAQRKFVLQIPTLVEQQRVAACLSSLDEMITAQSRKLDSLRAHKKGLIQKLFPSPEGV